MAEPTQFAPPARPAVEASLGEEVLGNLLTISHSMHPDDVPDAVLDHAIRLGASDAVLYLVDLEQRVLSPLSTRASTAAGPLDIDSTLAGRAFRTHEAMHGESESGERRLWLPLLDGADRLGVLAITAREVDDLAARRYGWLASLAAELVATKSAYGDRLVLVRRRGPMKLAAEFRRALLPPLTFASDHVEIAAMLEPAYEVAGDAFDYAVNGCEAHFAIFDAMGHGLEAARMANLAVAIHRHGRRHGTGLLETFMVIDAAVVAAFGPEHFVTGQLAVLDLRTGRLTYVNGGHPRPLLLRGTTIVGELAAEVGTPMGLGISPVINETSLEPGDRVILYTDGVVEARSPGGEEFGVDRLGDLLERAAAAQELPAETMRRLTHSVLAHEAGRLHDDATLLLAGWRRAMEAPRQL